MNVEVRTCEIFVEGVGEINGIGAARAGEGEGGVGGEVECGGERHGAFMIHDL